MTLTIPNLLARKEELLKIMNDSKVSDTRRDDANRELHQVNMALDLMERFDCRRDNR